jgi:hypothetical protein
MRSSDKRGCVRGLAFHDPALAMNETRLEKFVSDPLVGLDVVMEAAAQFAAYCNGNYSTQASSGCWYGKLFRIPKWLMHVFTAGRK